MHKESLILAEVQRIRALKQMERLLVRSRMRASILSGLRARGYSHGMLAKNMATFRPGAKTVWEAEFQSVGLI